MEISIYHIARYIFKEGREIKLTAMQWKMFDRLCIGPASTEELGIAVYGSYNERSEKSLRSSLYALTMKLFTHSKDIRKNSEGKYALPEGVVVRQFRD